MSQVHGVSGQISKVPGADSPEFKVVGIGASAGGLAALREFLKLCPADSGVAFVVVVHLSPDHPSLLSDLLQSYATVPVVQVTETLKLEPNHVYVIPPNRNISTIDTHVRLSPLESERRMRAPIDHFFATLSESHGASAVGVILSGTGSDGALGLRKVKAAGGLTIVQDPNESEYDGMPQSAIATGMVDFVLPIDEIPRHILRFISTEPKVPVPDTDQDELSSVDRKAMHLLFSQVRTRTGQDFSRYKESTVMRRIRRRMQIRQVEELPDYLNLLRESAEENHALLDDLLITVTNFFRDSETFDKLKNDVIPILFQDKGVGDRVRIWSVGCATGEEAYSLAILLLEHAGSGKDMPELQVFASDMHQRSLIRAREGFYPDSIEHDVTTERLSRFFTKVAGGYQVKKEVRGLVVFAVHNLLRDPPFSQIDLISCRNLMIYLKRDVQDDVAQLFHYALAAGRFLLLGSSETVGRSDLFQLGDKRHCLYTRVHAAGAESRLPAFPLTGTRGFAGIAAATYGAIPAGVLHQRLVERLAPPSIVVNPDYSMIHLSENAGAFLVQPGGEPTNNLLRRVRPELTMELARLMHEAKGSDQAVRSKALQVKFGGESRLISMRVSSVSEPDTGGLLLVIFDDMGPVPTGGISLADETEAARQQMGAELEVSKHRLQSLIQEYETGQQEMQAANEELQSTNEELRSTMEELETSKEELQSMNEELQTVNQENKHKVEELSQLTADLQHLLAATDIATLFLDRNLRILRFTPRLSELFNVRAVDRGRPLSDLTHRLGYDNLLSDASEVLSKLIPIEREVRSDQGGWYLTRMMPYRVAEDRIEGIVLTFVDITRLRSAEQASEESDERYRLLVENVTEYAIFTLDPKGRITTWNAGAQRLFGYAEREANGMFDMLFTGEDRADNVPAREIERALRDGQTNDDRCYVRRDGSSFWASGVLTVLRRPNGELRGFAKVMRDNSERRETQAQLESRNAELVRTNRELEEFAFVASHDLQEPLRMISIYSQLLLQFVDVSNSEKAKKFAEFVSTGAHRMEGLINDLLGYSRIIHDEGELNATVDCNAAFRQAQHVMSERIQATEAKLQIDKLPVTVGNERHLSVVFQNLLSNSLKYRKQGEPPQIHVSAERTGDEWTLTFADNGIGFGPQYADRIFGLFKRLHKDSYPGTGLGLAICKQIVERLGGKIWAKSDGEGLGAKIFVTLRAVPNANV